MNVAGKLREVTPVVQAAIVLLALAILRRLGIPAPTAATVLAALAVSRARAYELAADLLPAATALARPRGRPLQETPVLSSDQAFEVASAVRDYLMAHPGAVAAPGQRQQYTAGFRDFVLGLLAPAGAAHGMPLEHAARATGVPGDTLKDWLRLPQAVPGEERTAPPEPGPGGLPQGVIEQIVALWGRWEGDFTAFCKALRDEHRIQVSTHQVRQILELSGLRTRRRGPKPSPDPEAIRGALERFFPGAQWVADGKRLVVQIGSVGYAFTWELAVDAATGAHVGFDVRDAEDSEGLLEALDHGQQTTGSRPVAVLTDNLPANHSEAVESALAEQGVISMPSTVGRPENKACCEGAFGLFAQTMAPIVLPNGPLRRLARAILMSVLFAYCAGRNHVPRNGLRGRSAAQAYSQDLPSEEERVAAHQRLLEIRQRIVDRRDEDRRRIHPACLEMLTSAFQRLGLSDPEGRFVTAIGRCGFDAAAEAIAIFQAKVEQGRLDTDFPERYLLGIATNLAQRNEDLAVYRHLVDLRARHHDALLLPLLESDRRLKDQHTGRDYVEAALLQALQANATIDRRYWLRSVLAATARLTAPTRAEIGPWLARRIAHAYSIPASERDAFIANLAALTTNTVLP